MEGDWGSVVDGFGLFRWREFAVMKWLIEVTLIAVEQI